MSKKLDDFLMGKIFYNAPIAMAINDLETLNFIHVNKEFTRQTKFTKKDVVGKSPIEIGSWPDIESAYKIGEKLKENGYIRNTMVTVKTKDGKSIHGLYSAEIIDYEGKPCILGYSIDITELKEKEQQYQDLVELLPTSIVVLDVEMREVRFANPAACKLVGIDTYEEFVGQPAEKFLHPDWRDTMENRIQYSIETGKVTEPLVQTIYDINGKEVSIEAISKAISYKGRPSILAIFYDVSERTNLEEQIRQAAKLEAIGLLAGGVAHDFNNILTIIHGYTELLIKKSKKISDTKIQEYINTKLTKVCEASERAESLTKQLLAFSRKQILSPKIINLNELLVKEKELLKRLIREDIEISTHLDPELGNVYADVHQLGLVLMNLVINSRDAIPETEVGSIILETKNIYFDEHHVERKQHLIDKGQYVMLAVTDDGVGMNKETQRKIFEPFFTTKEFGKGVGLGLSTVYGIVKQSNGFIWMYSELGQGTTFKIYLPRVDEETNGDIIPNGNAKDLSGNETLLIVEDEKEVRILICETLKELGYKILSASNGIEAIELVKNTQVKIDMMVTDVVMPKMDGRELAVQLNSFLPDLKILYISGYTDNTIVHRGVLDVGTNFLQKPITPTLLIRKIREILNGNFSNLK
jgi:PAS domain S-box-containing protein